MISGGIRMQMLVMAVMLLVGVGARFIILVHCGERIHLMGTVVLLGQNDPLPWTELDFNRAPPLAPQPYYSREESHCFEDRLVYYNGGCWELKSRGPCGEGEWLVLDPESQGIKPVCQPRLCPSDKAYWMPTGECIPLTDRKMCNKKDTSLQVDSLGYGACKCMPGIARAMASNGVCYELFTRGFCDHGFVVGMDHEAEQFPAICVRDVCIDAYENSTSSDEVFLPYAGSCYPEGSHEPCREDHVLTVDVHTGKPNCEHDLNSWNIINPPPRCPLVDHNGDCRDRLTVKLQSDSYLNQLSTDRSKHRSKFGVSKG